MDHRLNRFARAAFLFATHLMAKSLTITAGVLEMSDAPIPIAAVIAKKVCARIERALCIVESLDDSVMEQDLTEVAFTLYQAQQTIRRLSLAGQDLWSNSPSSPFE
jgi:hypothetical protein